jgi:hypothetical protein
MRSNRSAANLFLIFGAETKLQSALAVGHVFDIEAVRQCFSVGLQSIFNRRAPDRGTYEYTQSVTYLPSA